MSSRTEPPSGEDGFSILEMIVAMTILALVLGIASQSIVMASRSIAAAKAEVETVRAVRTMLADYEASTEPNAVRLEALTQPGWSLKARKIEVSRANTTAIVIERTGVAGAARGGSFLTFVPEQDSSSP